MRISDWSSDVCSSDLLDGEPIKAQGQADAVGKLLDMIRQAKKAADEQRVIEKKPHDDAAKAVQTKYKPLIDKCELAASVAKKALVPWLEHLEAEQRADAERKRKEADEARQAALEAERAEIGRGPGGKGGWESV